MLSFVKRFVERKTNKVYKRFEGRRRIKRNISTLLSFHLNAQKRHVKICIGFCVVQNNLFPSLSEEVSFNCHRDVYNWLCSNSRADAEAEEEEEECRASWDSVDSVRNLFSQASGSVRDQGWNIGEHKLSSHISVKTQEKEKDLSEAVTGISLIHVLQFSKRRTYLKILKKSLCQKTSAQQAAKWWTSFSDAWNFRRMVNSDTTCRWR